MRKMIGEMDILVAQLSSELKFIKNGMKKSTCVFSCIYAIASLVILTELQTLDMSM